MRQKKPVVTAEVVNEFGRFEADAKMSDGRIDGLWTPGFSDMRHQRDIALRDWAEGEIKGNEVPTLPVNVRLVRNTKVGTAGEPDIKITQSQGDGYRTINEEDVGQDWLTEVPPGAAWAADGTLRKGDLTYMVIDQQGAARNRFRQQSKTMQQVEGAASSKLETLRKISAESEPTVEVLPSKGPIKSADVFGKIFKK
jgi:hypothetical protein